MTVLVLDSLENEVVQWLAARRTLRFEPGLAQDPRAFRHALREAQGVILPPTVPLDTHALGHAPKLRAVGCIGAGPDHVDLAACARAGVEVVKSSSATAPAEAEFILAALLSLLRRLRSATAGAGWVGRELQGATVGLVGMPGVARRVATLLEAFGAHVVGYDPALHASDMRWQSWGVKPVGLRELLKTSDAVSVQLNAFSRYHGLMGERYLPACKPNQVIVSIAHSALFDETALAEALRSGRIAAAWLDSVAPGALDAGRPLAGIASLQVTPCVASSTRESRLRSAWTVARRLDELLGAAPPAPTPTALARLWARVQGQAVASPAA